MKLSPFHIIILVTFGSLAVVGVLIFAFAVGGGNNNKIGPVTIWGTLDAAAFTTVIRQASENNPSLSQVSYVQKDPATYEQELTDALASGQGPDLFLMRDDYALKDAGKAVQIPFSSFSQAQFQSAFIDAASPLLSADGVLAVPLVADPLVMYWNKDMLATAGYSKPPEYWDEVIPMATFQTGASDAVNQSAITRRDSTNTIKKSAIAFGEYKNVDDAKDILATLILQAGGSITSFDSSGHLISAISPKVGDTALASESALRFFTEFADPSKDDYSWNRSLHNASAAFAAGDLALYVGHAGEEPLITRMNPNLNFSVALLPQVRGSDVTIDTAHVYGLSISRTSQNPTGAAAVAYLLASADISKALSVALGLPSARRDVLAQPTTGDDQIFARDAITSHAWVDPDPIATADIFRAMIEDTTSGAARLSDAVSHADQAMSHILGL